VVTRSVDRRTGSSSTTWGPRQAQGISTPRAMVHST
jgi:hypothetical protein